MIGSTPIRSRRRILGFGNTRVKAFMLFDIPLGRWQNGLDGLV